MFHSGNVFLVNFVPAFEPTLLKPANPSAPMKSNCNMKSKLTCAAMALMLASLARADYNPIPLTPGSFNADVIVENTAPKPFNDYTTATMDGGTNNNAWVWYEQGYASNLPDTGIPAHG